MLEVGLGDAFTVKTPPNGVHLYIIIAAISENKYLLVNTTTSNTQIDPDRDCIINPGEGVPNFITCQSTIAYRHARECRGNEIEGLIRQREWMYSGQFSEQHIYEIQRKGASSKQLKNKYKKVLQDILDNYEFYSMFG